MTYKIENDATAERARVERYWRDNVRLLWRLMAIWFVVSFGFGVLLVDVLNRVSLFGFKLGFWWAQQGAIYVFIALIFYYCWRMGRIEKQDEVDEQTPGADRGTAAVGKNDGSRP